MTDEVRNEGMDEEVDYVAVVQELRDNTVSKDEYNKLKSENQKLFKALAAGEKIAQETTPKKSIDELRKDVRTAQTSLDGIKASLALREAVLEKSGEDIFVPHGRKIMATDEDEAAAKRVAETFQQWVDASNDDPVMFASIMMSNTVDTVPPRKRR